MRWSEMIVHCCCLLCNTSKLKCHCQCLWPIFCQCHISLLLLPTGYSFKDSSVHIHDHRDCLSVLLVWPFIHKWNGCILVWCLSFDHSTLSDSAKGLTVLFSSLLTQTNPFTMLKYATKGEGGVSLCFAICIFTLFAAVCYFQNLYFSFPFVHLSDCRAKLKGEGKSTEYIRKFMGHPFLSTKAALKCYTKWTLKLTWSQI